jgi:hypothetical protein
LPGEGSPRRRRTASRCRSGYFSSEEILACDQAGITVTLPKPITSDIEAKGRFGKQDFIYLSDEDAYRCPAGEKVAYHYTNEEKGLVLRRYGTNTCQSCAIKQQGTTGKERRITRLVRCSKQIWTSVYTQRNTTPNLFTPITRASLRHSLHQRIASASSDAKFRFV